MKNKFEPDLCIINGGAIRIGLKKGNLARGQLIEVLPYFEDILDALEYGVPNLPTQAGRFSLALELIMILILPLIAHA